VTAGGGQRALAFRFPDRARASWRGTRPVWSKPFARKIEL